MTTGTDMPQGNGTTWEIATPAQVLAARYRAADRALRRLCGDLLVSAEASANLAKVVDYESTLQKVATLAVPHFADWSAVDMENGDGTLRRLAVDKIKTVEVNRLLLGQQFLPIGRNYKQVVQDFLKTLHPKSDLS